jgi:type II secretory pathway pseudopilin PulG
MTARRRLIDHESGFALFDLLIVVIIVGVLIAIAVSSYIYTRESAEEVAAKTNIRSTAPAIEAWREDNDGTITDVDGDASTSGYEGMTVPLLRAKYGRGIGGIEVPADGFMLTPGDYCISSTIGVYTFFKRGPDGPIRQVTRSTPLCS